MRCSPRLGGELLPRAQHSRDQTRTGQHCKEHRTTIITLWFPLDLLLHLDIQDHPHASISGWSPCSCSPESRDDWSLAGPLQRVFGLVGFLSLQIPHQGPDPLPCSGAASRQPAIRTRALLPTRFHVRPVPCHHISSLLSPSLFPQTDALHINPQYTASHTAPLALVHVVDKGPGQAWGVCRAWAWNDLTAGLLT